jgi:hypothetical protein
MKVNILSTTGPHDRAPVMLPIFPLKPKNLHFFPFRFPA